MSSKIIRMKVELEYLELKEQALKIELKDVTKKLIKLKEELEQASCN